MIKRLYDNYPEWPAGLLLRARLLDAEGRSSEAIAAYQEAIRYGAAGVLPYERLIDLLNREGKNSEAESYVDGLRQQSFAPEGADTLEAVLLANGRGDREKALEIVRGQAEKHPKNMTIQLSLGQMLLAMGKSAEAVAAFERAMDIAPEQHSGDTCPGSVGSSKASNPTVRAGPGETGRPQGFAGGAQATRVGRGRRGSRRSESGWRLLSGRLRRAAPRTGGPPAEGRLSTAFAAKRRCRGR